MSSARSCIFSGASANLSAGWRWRNRLIRWRRWTEREKEGCPLSHCALRPNLTVAALDDPADGCQPDSGSREFRRRMKPFKRLEDPPCSRPIKTDVVVLNEVDCPP